MPSLEIKNITFGYQNEPLFKNFSLNIQPKDEKGWIVGLLGESGIGKSTLLDLILKSKLPHSGEVISSAGDLIFSFQPQEHVLLEHLNIKENIEYLLNLSAYRHKRDEDHLDRLKKTLSIDDLLNSTTSVSDLSGGEKQRVMLARAMSIKPDVLILDEPTIGLDSMRKHALLIQLRQIANDFNCLVIMATHNIFDVRGVADEIIYLFKDGNTIKPIQKEIGAGNTEKDTFLDVLNSSYPFLAIVEYTPTIQKFVKSSEDLEYGDRIIMRSEKIKFTHKGNVPIDITFKNNHCIHLKALGADLIIPYSEAIQTSMNLSYSDTAFVLKKDSNFCDINLTIM